MKNQKVHLIIQIVVIVIWLATLLNSIITFLVCSMLVGAAQVIHAIILAIIVKDNKIKKLVTNYFIGLFIFLFIALAGSLIKVVAFIAFILPILLCIYFIYITYRIFVLQSIHELEIEDFGETYNVQKSDANDTALK